MRPRALITHASIPDILQTDGLGPGSEAQGALLQESSGNRW